MEVLKDAASEIALLSSIAQHGKPSYLDAADLLTSQSFTMRTNQYMYTVLSHIYNKNIDAKVDYHLVLSAAKDLGLVEEVTENKNYLERIFTFPVEVENTREFAQRIRKLQETNGLIHKLNDAVEELRKVNGSESMSEIVSKAETPIMDFLQKLTDNEFGSIEHIADGLSEYLNRIESGEKIKVGLSSGFPIYDKAIGYLRPGVHVVFARKKVGKSFFAINVALYNACKEKIPTLLMDTELRKENGQWNRMLARLSGVDIDSIEAGEYVDNHTNKNRIHKSANLLSKSPLDYLNVTGKDFEEVLSILRRWITQKVGYNEKGKVNDCLIIYDYLKLTQSSSITKNMQEYQVLGFRMQQLHDFTVQYNCPCLTFAQANKEMELAASDRVSWFATSVCNFQKKEPEEIAMDGPDNGNRKLIVQDCRFSAGLEDGDYINYGFNGKIAKLTEFKTRNDTGRERGRIEIGEVVEEF